MLYWTCPPQPFMPLISPCCVHSRRPALDTQTWAGLDNTWTDTGLDWEHWTWFSIIGTALGKQHLDWMSGRISHGWPCCRASTFLQLVLITFCSLFLPIQGQHMQVRNLIFHNNNTLIRSKEALRSGPRHWSSQTFLFRKVVFR